MVLAASFDDAKTKQSRYEGDGRAIKGGSTSTQFFGSRDNPNSPWAKLTRLDPGRVSGSHFHVVAEFQVIVDGKGRLGRHDLAPYCVHFARAYTPYGPLLSDGRTGFTFFVLRTRVDMARHRLPNALDELKQVPDHQPWQITHPVTFPSLQSGAGSPDTMLQAVPEIRDEQGLAVYTLSMKRNAKAQAPDPSEGDGQYVAVVKGSLLHDGRELKAPAVVFVYPKEGSFRID